MTEFKFAILLVQFWITMGVKHESVEFCQMQGNVQEVIRSKTSASIAEAACNPGYEMIKCDCITLSEHGENWEGTQYDSCAGSRFVTNSSGTWCQAEVREDGNAVQAEATCQRILINCESNEVPEPAIRCPQNYTLTGCQIKFKQGHPNEKNNETPFIPVVKNSPTQDACSPESSCSSRGDINGRCRVAARCVRTEGYNIEKVQPTKCQEPQPQPATCGGEQYKYSFIPNRAFPKGIRRLYWRRMSNVNECLAECSKECRCAAVTYIKPFYGSNCMLSSVESLENDLREIDFPRFVGFGPDGGYYRKLGPNGNEKEYRLLANGKEPPGVGATCLGKEYEYKRIPKVCTLEGPRKIVEADQLKCQELCSRDCQCRFIQQRDDVCELILHECRKAFHEEATESDKQMFVRYEKGTTPDLGGTCGNKEYDYYPVELRYCGRPRDDQDFTGITLEECMEKCSAACDCQSIQYERGYVNHQPVCRLQWVGCKPEELLLVNDNYSVYYIKKEKGVCAPKYKKNCKRGPVAFHALYDKSSCSMKYRIGFHAFPERISLFDADGRCQAMCAENCDCEAIRLQHGGYNYSYTLISECHLMGSGCVQNMEKGNPKPFLDKVKAAFYKLNVPGNVNAYDWLSRKVYYIT